MKPVTADQDVRDKVRHILEAPSLNISRDDIREMAEQVIVSLRGDLSVSHIQLYNDLSGLAKFIENARSEIAAISPADIGNTHIPNATGELGAIVGATEEATGAILDSCEQIEILLKPMQKNTADEIQNHVTRIYEACNFQDLTGQRINKVVNTLDIIDKRVKDLLAAFTDKDFSFNAQEHQNPSNAAPKAPPSKMADSDLLNGPQLPEEAKRQAEIDAILASFN